VLAVWHEFAGNDSDASVGDFFFLCKNFFFFDGSHDEVRRMGRNISVSNLRFRMESASDCGPMMLA
jgi:hypothetical protein